MTTNRHENASKAPGKRPLGVTIAAVLEIIQGLLFLVLGILSLPAVVASRSAGGATTGDSGINNTAGLIVGGILAGSFLFLGLVLLLVARYLWNGKYWAFWATVVLEVLFLLGSLWNIVTFVAGSPTPYMNWFSLVTKLVEQPVAATQVHLAVVMIILPIVTLLLLGTTHVRSSFRKVMHVAY